MSTETVEPSDPQAPVRVLFVCLGNICRSPMAEAVFRHKVEEAGLSDKIEVDSAGTGNWHAGERPHRGTRKTLRDRGISDDGLLARQITQRDLDEYDYILTMDASNLANVQRLGPAQGLVRALMQYAPHLGHNEVPDPYYDGRFNHVYELVEAACEGLLAQIRHQHGL